MTAKQAKLHGRPRLNRLREEHEAAAKAMCDAVAEEYPVGTVVDARIHHHMVRGEVVGHNTAWWYEPGAMTIRNLKTNKTRRFNPTYQNAEVEIVSKPSN